MKAPKIKSQFALLDVLGKDGTLNKRVEKGEKVSVVIRGTITGVAGHHDGTSREYEVEVDRVETAE